MKSLRFENLKQGKRWESKRNFKKCQNALLSLPHASLRRTQDQSETSTNFSKIKWVISNEHKTKSKFWSNSKRVLTLLLTLQRLIISQMKLLWKFEETKKYMIVFIQSRKIEISRRLRIWCRERRKIKMFQEAANLQEILRFT